MLQAVIFDMDGLLIDSEPFWRAAHIAAVAEHGVTITEEDVRPMAGKRTDEVVAHWRQAHGLGHVPSETLEASIVKGVLDRVASGGQELPGVRKIIRMLQAHHIPMAVASSSAPEIIDVVLAKLQLRQHMAFAYSAKNEPLGKPHPGVFLTTAAKLGVDPANCVAFEDALNGVRAAKAAGMRCVAVPERVNLSKPEFRAEADLVLANLAELSWPMLNKLFS